jgi:hypothetical protein
LGGWGAAMDELLNTDQKACLESLR